MLTQRRGMKTLSVETRDRIAAFQRWLYHDVLPTIAATGSYSPAPARGITQVDLYNPDVLLPLLASYAQGNVALKAELVVERQAHEATTTALADAHVRADADRPKIIAQERQALADGELGLSEAAVALGVDRIRVVDHFLQLGFLVRGVDGRCRSTREGRRSGLVRQTVGTKERMDGSEILRGSVVVTATGYTHLAELFCRGAAGAGQPALPGL
ncbi:hypothetical protein MKK68_02170 [Methylobacterium sp. E-016]|uniref:hypothetical protein n=1 Tax=Methylobacterium sp. E-016 TaxID=2836556 RepID=UPI001FB89D17|nr:hypothetical protein [Methylobacterium sp. E-016]MCJ2074467.1 hypothetical protein [Methylobacterium sp. E-016]